jgi:hypothetical protein
LRRWRARLLLDAVAPDAGRELSPCPACSAAKAANMSLTYPFR